MNKLKIFAALCCAALLLAACDKDNEPKNDNDPANDTKEAVDLGLSVKWATCNVGATSPEKYGNYYAWGEIEPKSDFSWGTYKYGTENNLTKYNATDGLTTLEAADDVATAKWSKEWRMPTDAEWQELMDSCTWTWTTKNDVKGYEVKASNGKSIFLPAAGWIYDKTLGSAGSYGRYWSSSLSSHNSNYAWYMFSYSGSVDSNDFDRYYGLSVRPVCE